MTQQTTKESGVELTDLEEYFALFRDNIVGNEQTFGTPYGEKRVVYMDWTASGRLYKPIEEKMMATFGPFVGNTHSESSVTGMSMTRAYHHACHVIKKHVNADPDDVLLNVGFGMTAAINKLQRILGLRVPEQLRECLTLSKLEKPVVFVTHMEHHSNQTSWIETIADVHVIKPTEDGLVDMDDLVSLLDRFKTRNVKIGSFTACSNVTGIETPYHALAKIMHEHGGICIVDFAASAPYVPIDMHPPDPLEKIDAITFSPHKFLGGPGSSGALIFDSHLYHLKSPDQPGGGTVLWTNPWGEHKYKENIEEREDGGTPGFLQTIRTALAIQLKEQMGTEKIRHREEQLVRRLFAELKRIPRLVLLADGIEQRLGMFSFYFDSIHYNLVVRLLNDRFGIQARGGCSCAGTYGHYLLHMDHYSSKRITDRIDAGDLSSKPGWVRISIHPTTRDAEVEYLVNALKSIGEHYEEWVSDYSYDKLSNEYSYREIGSHDVTVEKWFDL